MGIYIFKYLNTSIANILLKAITLLSLKVLHLIIKHFIYLVSRIILT